ncbi:MAG: hypothetical protein AB1696_02760 [Planctomycetota bacterium]
MKSMCVATFAVLILTAQPALCYETKSTEGKDDIEIFATVFRIAVFPIDFFGSPGVSGWGEAWTLPFRGADLIEYQDKFYYDYGTKMWRENHDPRRTGGSPFTEFKSPDRRPRETPTILYLPPARR